MNDSSKNKIRILVVEDENIVALDIERGLKRLGYSVIAVVNNGPEAIEMVGKHHPELVLMDIQIKGGMDGIQTADEIRKRFNVPVVFLTAYADEATLQRAKTAEPYGYLLKPFEETELHTAIEVVLQKHKAFEAKQASSQADLFLSEERFKLFVNSVKEYAIFMLDTAGNVVSWNPGAERIKGYKVDEVIGRNFRIFYTQEDQISHKPEAELEIAEREGKFEEEYWRVKKDGSKFWAHIMITSLRTNDGKLRGFGKVTRDLTESKKIQEALLETTARKTAIFEASLDCIISMDPEGKIIEFNKAAELTFGHRREDVIGREMAEVIIPPRMREAHRNGLKKYLSSGVGPVLNKRLELSAIRSDGSEFPVELTIVELKLPNQTIFTGFLRDITDRKRTEDELKRSKESAEIANNAKTYFLANMSHEIRTPLGAILGFSELMQSPDQTPSDIVNWGQKIKNNGEHLLKVVDEILDISKVEAGRLEVEFEDIDTQGTIFGVVNLFSQQVHDKNIKLDVHLKTPIPKTIKTDPTRIKQVLLNIIGNAIKFSPSESQIDIEISLMKDTTPPQIVFTVKDQGPGLAPEQVGRLFQPFVQADSSYTRKFGGTGLGLALAKRLAKNLGGDVTLKHTQPGKGSTFQISIEASYADDVQFISDLKLQESKSAAHVKLTEEFPNLKGLDVLLVEDALDNQLLIGRFLKMAGANVTVANDGSEGVKKALEDHFDLILMDIQMPYKDGYQATAELRAKGLHTPIIALTAHALAEERERSLRAGCNDHITKPVNRKGLLESISRIVANSRKSPPHPKV